MEYKIENKVRMILIGMFLITTLALPASAATTVSIGNFSVDENSNVNGSLVVNNVIDFFAANITISYNPLVVLITNVKSPNPDIIITSNINNETGSTRIIAEATSFNGLSGDVALANISFMAVGAAGSSSPLNLALNQMIDKDGNDIPATSINGNIRHNRFILEIH